MKHRPTLPLLLACLAPALALAHEPPSGGARGAHGAHGGSGMPAAMAPDPAPAMSAEDQKMMEAWAAASTPGKEHETLRSLEGTFDVKVASRMKPADPLESSTGRAEARMIFGGRHLEERFTGTFMGQPFEGIGYTSYDNIRKQYVSTWIDSMGTGVMTSMGTADAGGKTLTLTGECVDPMTGKTSANKQVLTIDGPNRHVVEMWSKDPKSGETFKAMEITYTRTGTAQND